MRATAPRSVSRAVIIFSAIKLPADITRDIVKVQRGVAGARWSPEENLHITTGYYGNQTDDIIEQLDDELAKITVPSFDLQLEGAGHFGHAEPHALWLGVKDNPVLTQLHVSCRAAARRAGITMEKRNYRPHVTLAYLGQTTPLERIVAFEKRLSRFNTKPFLIDEMRLFSSWPRKGSPNIYRDEASYPFLFS